MVSRSGNARTRSSPSHAASSARQRRARSSLGATSAMVRPLFAISADHANARAPAVASVIETASRSPSRAASSRYRSLRSASARMPPSRARAGATALAIEPLHRARQALAKGDLDRLGRARECRLGGLPFVGGERREDVFGEIGNLGGVVRRRDADAETREVLADGRDDRAHPLVRTRAAALAQPDLAEWEVNLIEDHEERGGIDAIAIEQLADRAARVVHEGLRTRDRDPHAVDRAFGDPRVGRFHRELGPRALREPRRHLKARVVTRRRVALAGVAEPDHNAIDARRRGHAAAAEQLRESRHGSSKTPKRPVHSDGASDAYFRSTIASATVRVERSVIGSSTRIASSAPATSRPRRCGPSFSTSTGATSCGRVPAPSPTVTRTHALRVTSPGWRPARWQAALISSRSDANPSGELPYQLYHAFHASTCGRAIPNIRAPLEPSNSGMRRDGRGRSTASSTVWKRPWNVTRSPASKRRTISKASSKREASLSEGTPNARNSGSFQPAPRPSTSRPPLTSSTDTAIRARIPGAWNAVAATSGPSRTRDVIAASAASCVQTSQGPRSGRPSVR